jgi:hypothetical protein
MSGEWTTEWPKVPGWYWVWKQSERPDGWPMRETVRVRWAGSGTNRHLLYTGRGAILYECEWPGLQWGPRIDVPDAPDGTPGTRYAAAALTDQTHTYLTDDGCWTTVHAKARLFHSRSEARSAVFGAGVGDGEEDTDWWIEPIDDIDEFGGRPDTW